MSATRDTGTKSAGADKGLRFTVPRSAILGAIARTAAVIERKNTVPILSYVLLRLRSGVMEMIGTDMEIAMISRVSDVSIQREGSAVLPASTLLEVVKKLPDNAEVTIDQAKADSSDLSLTAGRYSIKLNTLDPADFPAMVDGKFNHTFGLATEALRDALDRVSFAMSNEETRYYLNGIYIHAVDKEKLRFVSTDGHRLARNEIILPTGAAGMPGIILPRKTVSQLRRMLDGITGEITISVSDTKMRFELATGTLTTKLIDGSFPEYERVIPKGNSNVLTIDRAALTESVGLVAAISSEKARPVKLAISNGQVVVSSQSPDTGHAQDEIDGQRMSYNGPALEVGFQARYLADVAAQIGPRMEFRLGDGTTPALVVDPANPGFVSVLMPMRV